uniref:Cwf15/Cwc15 cell cycle control protein n=1 Tax=Chlamydomonas leiostraca TaxID=1034604 RepID=A0A7S0RTB5_9CHLO|mmetsp:Transcript_30648/g.78262  ORF Transcript_30648/g.78262 Transcript_30648/m.78262 type:complete len:229 (+) Transcript_30648:15-701(+)|eukprot:CAMPEP_0202868242 /NCGR_PEP_ID=MMETSP1391-20130828/10557_1 /ASSEMBLY_ACC=CAM_ASM_000867 /TAXON_ID=1034604 /ORGANISM="Chlamydomonas leiostraca, Strain SAG 11-49" /LENGTH=228 /DNA_ID=CAMNT_0049548385 /DNA_START=14 /DNA_END=700 /DNA_ORIENTATION=+
MTTAHRPTWAPAKGGEEQGGARFYVPSRMMSAKNLPGHTKLKYRQEGQASAEEIAKKDLRSQLEEKERKHQEKTKGINFEEERKRDLELLQAEPADAGRAKQLIPKAADADDEDEGDESSSSSDDDDEDEEAALMAELERIKKERAEEARKKAVEEAARAAKEKEAELVGGNPLLSIAGDVSFNLKRRWDDDVVFKNQARSEPKAAKRFINDTIRNDFHKRFLQRYIR